MSLTSKLTTIAAAGGGASVAWALELDTAGENQDFSRAVITSNYIYILGTDASTSPASSYIIQADHNGGVNWERRLTFGANDVRLVSATADSSENLYVFCGSGDPYIAKISPSGTILEDKNIAGSGWEPGSGDIYIDGSDLYVTGEYSEPIIVKLTTALSSITWARASNTSQRMRGISTDSSGNVYTLTSKFTGSSQGLDWVIIKYNSSGTQQWSQQFRGVSGNNDDTPYTIDATSSASHFYVAGVLQNGETHVAAISKSNGSTIVWQKQINGGTYSQSTPPIVKTDSLGNVYFAMPSGTSGYAAYVIKFSSSGVVQWKNQITGFYVSGEDKFGFDVSDDFFVVAAAAQANSKAAAFKAPTDGTGLDTYGSYTYQESSIAVSNGILVFSGAQGVSNTNSQQTVAVAMTIATVSESLTLYN